MSEPAGDRPTLSLVVNYFNPKAFSRVQAIATLCLEALRDCTRATLEVILSDGSGVECPAMQAQCERLGFTYTLSPVPKNFEAIYNHGLAMARGEYVGILENDVFVVQGWDEKLLAEMRRTGAAVVVPYLSSCDNHIQQTGFVARHVTFEPSCISHNFVVFDRRAYAVLVPLDTRFNANFNDNDMFIRARRAGLRIVVVNCGGIVHYRGSSAVYNPWNPMEVDCQIFMDKYPELKTWRVPVCPYDFSEPFFCRSRLYRWLLKFGACVPGRRAKGYAVKHLTRLEPLFHRV